MKKILITSFLFLLSVTMYAQISYITTLAKFNVTTTPGNRPLLQRSINNSPGSISTTPSSAFILEYGDGYFTSDTSSIHYYKNSRTKTAVLTLSGRYDTIKPPQIFAMVIKNAPVNQSGFYYQQLLSTGDVINVTPIASDLNVRDEMLFIITYRKPIGITQGTITFFYNQTEASVFNVIDTASVILPTVDNGGVPIKRIRWHSTESWAGTGASGSRNVNGNSYSNALVWNINPLYDSSAEHNIFVSLRTKDNFPKQNKTHVEAIFQYTKEADTVNAIPAITESKFSSRTLTASLDPHDPNYITTFPKCIVKGTEKTKVNYLIHFQNEGDGAAYKLEIDVKMDRRLKDALLLLDSNSFNVTVGNKEITTLNLHHYRLSEDSFRLRIDLGAGMSDSSLSSNKVPVWFCNSLTMGDVSFDLSVPDTAEADLAAMASIIFYNGNKSGMKAVNTKPDTLFIREPCNDNLFPRITPLSAGPTACTTCCKTFLSLCWWWWIVIGAGVVLVTLLIIKRRKKTDSYNS